MIPVYKKKLAKQLTICISYAVACVFYIVGIFAIDQYRQRHLQMKCDKEAQTDFQQLINIVEFERNRAEAPAEDFIQLINDNTTFNYRDEESVYTALEYLIKDNELITKATIGFEDWVYPQYADKNGFGPQIIVTDSGLVRLQLGEKEDFRKNENWKKCIRPDRKTTWIEPHFTGDSTRAVSSFHAPVYIGDTLLGQIVVDIDMVRFSENVEQFRPYPSCLITLVDDDLRILIHANRSYIGRTKLNEAMQRVGIDPNIHPLYHVKDRQGGVSYDYLGSRHMAFYYMPVPNTSWMVLLYCPTEEIYAPIMTRHFIYIALGILGFLFLGAMFGISLNRYMRTYRYWHRADAGYSDDI